MRKDYLDVWGTNTTKSYMLTYVYFISKSTKQRNGMIQENNMYLKDAGSLQHQVNNHEKNIQTFV